jgi:hypothetical protein
VAAEVGLVARGGGAPDDRYDERARTGSGMAGAELDVIEVEEVLLTSDTDGERA